MNQQPCPRCGSQRPVLGPCPECGYEDPHPGVLGAYREALDVLRRRPGLLVPFLVPVAVLLATQGLLTTVEAGTRVATPREVAAGLTALFLQAGWYLLVLGAIVPAVSHAEDPSLVPEGPVYVAAAQGGLLVVAPWALLAGILLLQPAGGLGALALVASLVLLISTIVAVGRAVGLPVEAALSGAHGLALFRQGNARARENGGLGLAFLALLALAVAFAGPAIAIRVLAGEASTALMVALGSATSWLIGAWAGVAMAIGLSGGSQGVQETFACPRCGAEARAQAGRARCECGLEGPYYPGARSG